MAVSSREGSDDARELGQLKGGGMRINGKSSVETAVEIAKVLKSRGVDVNAGPVLFECSGCANRVWFYESHFKHQPGDADKCDRYPS